jgi:molybdopterin-guanine dinucleotide biosynthesis protein A
VSPPPRFAVAIFAGGEGSRIGGGKPLIRLGSKTLIEHAFERARAWSSEIVIALRSPHQLGDISLPSIIDDPAIEGPLAGLAAALAWGQRQGTEALLTMPCDMPLLPDDLPRRLGAALAGEAAVLASSNGRLHPICGLWRTDGLRAIPAYCATGRRSLRGFAESVGFAAVDWPADPVDPFFNINSKADLAEAERLIAA